MNKVLFVLIFIVLAGTAFAQQSLLSFDEHNKYIYYQVADMPGLPADTLQKKCVNFIKTWYPKITLKTINTSGLSGSSGFITYGGLTLLKHQKGEITYQLNVEFKDQKYRFWLTDFVFTPYQRDRYGNFVPQKGVEIPFENALTKLDKKDFDGYLDETGTYCKQWGDQLKQYMLKVPAPKKQQAVKKIVTDKW